MGWMVNGRPSHEDSKKKTIPLLDEQNPLQQYLTNCKLMRKKSVCEGVSA